MERLQAAVIAACTVSILTGILQLLRPNEKFDRQLRLFTAGLMLFSILVPLLQGISEIQPDWSLLETEASVEDTEMTEQVQEELRIQVEQNVEQTLQTELQARGIQVFSLDVHMYISEEDCIEMSSVTVVCDAPVAAKQILRSDLGEEVNLIVEATSSTSAE